MSFPHYFRDVPGLVLRDPLAELLGAAEQGRIEYGYADAVKFAGHSCPTVAGAYLMTWHALRMLYGDELPERGAIAVELREALSEGTTGVVAGVAGLLTGAAGAGGFKGLGGRFARCGLLRERTAITAPLAFQRVDTGRRCLAHYHPERVPADPETKQLLPLALTNDAQARSRFATLWQRRVACILTTHFHDPEVVRITPSPH